MFHNINTQRTDIPFVNVHWAHEQVDSEGPLDVNGEPWNYLSYKDMRGAFEYKMLHCPVKIEGKAKNKRVVPDYSTPPSLEKGGLLYWARVRGAREIFELAKLRYPQGVWLYSKGAEGNLPLVFQYLDFHALLKMGAFLNGGSATGISLLIAEILISLSRKAEKRENGWDTDMRGRIKGLAGALRKWMQKSSLKKIGQGAKRSVSGKVTTSHGLRVSPLQILVEEPGKEDRTIELPVVAMNPTDDMVQLLKVKEGDIITFGRSPMVYRAYAIVRLHPEVAIGSVEISAEVWAVFNRGDGDGDPLDTRNEMLIMQVNENYELSKIE